MPPSKNGACDFHRTPLKHFTTHTLGGNMCCLCNPGLQPVNIRPYFLPVNGLPLTRWISVCTLLAYWRRWIMYIHRYTSIHCRETPAASQLPFGRELILNSYPDHYSLAFASCSLLSRLHHRISSRRYFLLWGVYAVFQVPKFQVKRATAHPAAEQRGMFAPSHNMREALS